MCYGSYTLVINFRGGASYFLFNTSDFVYINKEAEVLENFFRWNKKSSLSSVYTKIWRRVFLVTFYVDSMWERKSTSGLCVYKTVNRGGCYYFWVLTNSNSIVSTSENVYILLKEVAVVIWQILFVNKHLWKCVYIVKRGAFCRILGLKSNASTFDKLEPFLEFSKLYFNILIIFLHHHIQSSYCFYSLNNQRQYHQICIMFRLTQH